jgi:uncharacterized delta-60 repeat protein
MIVGGIFSDVDGQPRSDMARLFSNGSLDPSFVSAVPVETFVLQPDGKLVVFDRTSSARSIRRLNSDGSIDATFTAAIITFSPTPSYIRSMAMAPDGKIYVGGDFSSIGGVTRHHLARLNSDGTVDTTFTDTNPKFSLPFSLPFVFELKPLPDGKVIVGGSFKEIAGLSRHGIALLNADGTADSSFNVGLIEQDTLTSLTTVEDGKIYIAFVRYSSGSVVISKRILTNGSTDASFAPTTVGLRNCVPQVAGKYVCTAIGSNAFAVRVNAADGSVDPTFSAISNVGAAGSVVVQADDKVLVAGSFGPSATMARKWPKVLARLKVNGALDEPAVAKADFSGDLSTDISVFRPSTGQWFVRSATAGYSVVTWGVATDKIVPADYDGDGKTDYAIFRETESNWYIINSADSTITINTWGVVGDVPLGANYDDDRKADRMIYRPSESNWYLLSSKYGIRPTVQYGAIGDKPVIGDFDGDNLTDLTTFRPTGSTWRALLTSSGTVLTSQWGQSGDILTPGDYDGDRVTDFAIFRPSTNEWFHRTSSNPGGLMIRVWGVDGDIPVPGDYDGDRVADRAIYRASTKTWYVLGTQGWQIAQFGEAGDILTPIAY